MTSTKRNPGPSDEPTEPQKTSQKKPYRPPQFDVLTPDQAKSRLIEKGLAGEAETEQLLKAASEPRPSGTKGQRSIAGETNLREINSAKRYTQN